MAKKVQNNLKEGKDELQTIGQRFKVQFDLSYIPSQGATIEESTNPEMVQPNLNLTVRQLLEKHTRGTAGNIETKQPLYFDFTIPQIQDLTDVDRYQKYLEEQIQKTREFMKEQHEEYKRLQKIKDEKKTIEEKATFEELSKKFAKSTENK